jgi:hypothetical protein
MARLPRLDLAGEKSMGSECLILQLPLPILIKTNQIK